MGAYKYIAETLQKQYKARDALFRSKVISWRSGPAMEQVDKPANLARARRLGYQAKQGYIIVRTRIDKGRRTRRKPKGGRKHKNYYRFVQPQMSHQAIAEQRVNRKYRNMEVLNSYWIGEDGNYKFFEVILADPSKPSVNISSAIRQGKSFRGLTSAGNSRGASKKKGLNKRLRRKDLSRQPYHFVEYVKKEKVVKPTTAKPEASKPKTPPAAVVQHAHPASHAVEHARAAAIEHAHPATAPQHMHPAAGHQPAAGHVHALGEQHSHPIPRAHDTATAPAHRPHAPKKEE